MRPEERGVAPRPPPLGGYIRYCLGHMRLTSQVKSRDQLSSSRGPSEASRAAAQKVEGASGIRPAGDVGENALGTVPPLSCKVCTRRPTLNPRVATLRIRGDDTLDLTRLDLT